MDGWIDDGLMVIGLVDGWWVGCVSGWVNGWWVGELVRVLVDGFMEVGWMHAWTSGWMDSRMLFCCLSEWFDGRADRGLNAFNG